MKLLFVVTNLLVSLSLFAQIETYFNQNKLTKFTDPYRNIERAGDNFEQILIDQIGTAQTRVWVAVQEINLPRLAHAIANKKMAGLDVRVIIENSYHNEFSQFTKESIALLKEESLVKYQEFLLLADMDKDGVATKAEQEWTDALFTLKSAGIKVIDDTADGSAGTGLMHHKFVVIDDRIIVTGSNNFTTSCFFGDMSAPGTRGNSNSMLVLKDRLINQHFADEFLMMWGSGTIKPKFGKKKTFREGKQFTLSDGSKVTIIFSPFSAKIPWEKTSNGLIAKALTNATSNIKFALFVLSEQKFSDAMEIASNRGVAIKGLIDPVFVYQYYSGALDMFGIERLSYRCEPQKDNGVWSEPIDSIGTPRMPYGDKLHHKFGVVDDSITIVGSHNWSDSANEGNDETLLIINSESIAALYNKEFERLSLSAIWGLPHYISSKIEEEKTTCLSTPSR